MQMLCMKYVNFVRQKDTTGMVLNMKMIALSWKYVKKWTLVQRRTANFWFWCRWFGHRGRIIVDEFEKEGSPNIFISSCSVCERVTNVGNVLNVLEEELNKFRDDLNA